MPVCSHCQGDIVDLPARQTWFQLQLRAKVSIVWTDNRTSMISIRGSARGGYQVRLHHMFRQAPHAVWLALVTYARGDSESARPTLRAYIQNQEHLIRQSVPTATPRAPILHPKGRYFDLDAIYRDLNQTYFKQQVQAGITWARRSPKRPRTSIRFGSYDSRQRLIRIHQLLDQDWVPQYVVENVVFHEMLHQLIPRQRANGRWVIHPPEFRRAERRYRHYERAEQWQKQHLARLLS